MVHHVHGRNRGQLPLVPGPPVAACRPPLERGRSAAAARTAGVTISSVRVTIDRLPSGRSRWGAGRRGAATAVREGAGERTGREDSAGRGDVRSGRAGRAAARTFDASGVARGFGGTGGSAAGEGGGSEGAGDGAGAGGLCFGGRGDGLGVGGVGRGGRGIHAAPAERSRLTPGARTDREAPGQRPVRPAVASTRVLPVPTERWVPPSGWGRRPAAAACGTMAGGRCGGVTVRGVEAAVAEEAARAGELLVEWEGFGGRLSLAPPSSVRAAAASTTDSSAARGASATGAAATAAPQAVAPIARHTSATAASCCRPSRPAVCLSSRCRTR